MKPLVIVLYFDYITKKSKNK